jgi:biopolymer transport protein ExbD
MNRARMARKRTALGQYSAHLGPNMTPMVDVVMVILVFFMVSAAFIGPEWLLKSTVAKAVAVDPAPSASGTGSGASDDKALRLGPTQIYLRLRFDAATGATTATWLGRVFPNLDEVRTALQKFSDGVAKEKIEVLLDPAANVPYKDYVRVHDICSELGITKVGLMPGRVTGK